MPDRATPETKARALELYVTHGPTAAARECGVSKGAVCNWAKAEGIKYEPVQLKEERAPKGNRRVLNSGEWREEMTEILREITIQAAILEGKLLAQKGKGTPSLEKVTAVRTKAVSDLLLITGEATQRIGLQGDAQEHASNIARLRDELAERRKAKEAG